jgi:hypothetical protein
VLRLTNKVNCRSRPSSSGRWRQRFYGKVLADYLRIAGKQSNGKNVERLQTVRSIMVNVTHEPLYAPTSPCTSDYAWWVRPFTSHWCSPWLTLHQETPQPHSELLVPFDDIGYRIHLASLGYKTICYPKALKSLMSGTKNNGYLSCRSQRSRQRQKSSDVTVSLPGYIDTYAMSKVLWSAYLLT